MKKVNILILLIVFTSTLYGKNSIIIEGNEGFAVTASTTGNFSISNKILNIELNNISIKNKFKEKENIIGFRIGIAKSKEKSFEIKKWSSNKKLNLNLKPNEIYIIKNYKTIIPINEIQNLSSYWLVIQIEIKHNKNIGTTYSHSQKGLFKNNKLIENNHYIRKETNDDKIVNIRVGGPYTKIYINKIDINQYYKVIEERDGEKFYLKNNIQGKKTTMKSISTKIVNGKKISQTEYKDYFIYNLKCIKLENVYFNCIDR